MLVCHLQARAQLTYDHSEGGLRQFAVQYRNLTDHSHPSVRDREAVKNRRSGAYGNIDIIEPGDP